jgi:tetratricopeptide (TPR) repeat protein
MSVAIKKLAFVRNTSLVIYLSSLLCFPGFTKEASDWRTDYNAMVQSYNISDYDKATAFAKTALDKVLTVSDSTEKNIALEQIANQLRILNSRYEHQQNYSHQESVLRMQLKAEESKTDKSLTYVIARIKKNLAVCLVLEGKTREAEKYLPKAKTSMDAMSLAKGWKRDVELLKEANRSDDRENMCKFANISVEDVLSIKNSTEKDVAFNQLTQQLHRAKYKFDRGQDYGSKEQILKLILKVQRAQETQQVEKSSSPNFGYYPSTNTLKELVACLVMEGKNEEAATYDAQYKEINARATQQAQDFQRTIQDQLAKTQVNGKSKTDSEETK